MSAYLGAGLHTYDSGVSRVLVTGMSGVGKATLLKGLARRGHTVVDTDDNGWVLDDGRWDELRMHELLAHADKVVVSGTTRTGTGRRSKWR